MTEATPDLFPGFESHRFATQGAEIFARVAGGGPTLFLLHGYPQTHAIWHLVAPKLAERFRLIIPDLRGYGASSIPPTVPDHSTFSKNRHGRFRESGVFRWMFDEVVRRCMAAGLVKGEGFAVDASLVAANASHQHRNKMVIQSIARVGLCAPGSATSSVTRLRRK